ncbi:MAG: hypothetical protein O2948_00700 [Proteobacteria bacterium]|jgi:hypothetical protein|nr:hypothetical protein [Pseudomonadota bacterium]MDA0927171.1 hypothetical protein [Pseudomonadota bacterium]
MSLKNYLFLCAGISLATVVSILLIPGVAQLFESLILGFLFVFAN